MTRDEYLRRLEENFREDVEACTHLVVMRGPQG
jgi:hypothetical protein